MDELKSILAYLEDEYEELATEKLREFIASTAFVVPRCRTCFGSEISIDYFDSEGKYSPRCLRCGSLGMQYPKHDSPAEAAAAFGKKG